MTFLEDADAMDAELRIAYANFDLYQQKLKIDSKHHHHGQQKSCILDSAALEFS
jgi:hypothetical protein